MKKILIIGENSYIGISFRNWILKFNDEYEVESISVKTSAWKKVNFSKYHVVLYLSAIVHIKEKDEALYYKVNHQLAVQVAKKAKEAGIKHFIFMSTMSVYGLNKGIIDIDTDKFPTNHYGKSKLMAENDILDLESENFLVSIVRPPMVYGKNCRGNYDKLSKLAKKTPFFIITSSYRSMIYIDNLSLYLKVLIDSQIGGIHHPQNSNYVNVSEMFKTIRLQNKKKTFLFNINPKILENLLKWSTFFSKVFGTLIYTKELSLSSLNTNQNKYIKKNEVNFCKSIYKSEKE
ncbi:NAD-dependent epimerase/dehydratase family protein [Enterococcus casseliflavus]|uniref:NAD-dependent epimerase/dehydratase family protein n=1 Tax=Enterococcus casseliflavus TaxID=37734 RepID=UPI001CD1BB72|nr:NAD-dependent epimerase/dehydratase family protein [Enterococcus casseliflavus]